MKQPPQQNKDIKIAFDLTLNLNSNGYITPRALTIAMARLIQIGIILDNGDIQRLIATIYQRIDICLER